MGWLEFVAAFIGHLVSWPVLVAVVVFAFRKPFAELIGRIKSYEGLGQKINFGEQLAEAESSVDRAIRTIDAPRDFDDGEGASTESPLTRGLGASQWSISGLGRFHN